MQNEHKSFTFQEIKQKLINYCVYQDRCHKEVEEKMRDFLLIPEAKDEILLYLIKENYLNEERFTRSYIRGKFYVKHWGRQKIKLQLKMKGISEKLIQNCMDEIYDDDYIKQIKIFAEKLLPTYKDLNDFQRKNKLIRFLVTKGYEYELIIENITG
ncbi:regulatory protein RecX [Elizabethkingia anophelis]|uniref:regulatory protein RecX n=1 Tax=Elizabethkingia anophelis TaxID=1117645 RepID=UPI00136EE150|nr:regulatory protein RecX [Elizabethkingia anophelis]EJC8061670.1 RecX family transcriptional regulator [Elizabethkingia anophelis]MCL1642593.1 RecX family transcriptional regulator [Elizabethkingia anophelis]MCL1645842.1 RecX family transcriptional regulator [Elizabethkingia anophelis]MCT3927204.1 RecX family transcriptional regulator [Elizabethkingia anophelis]MCT4034775.1 RecX family transcriptional regulator [Elizabethkingia anophelis]